MIYSLRGKLLHAEPGFAVVECCGVGYRCAVSLTTLSQLGPPGDEVLLYTHMAIRDDSAVLYGFADARELAGFRLLTSVNGVGARLALALLSDFTADRLALMVASGDAKGLTRTAGIGNKLAQRIVLELKDKLGSLGEDSAAAQSGGGAPAGAAEEAAAALTVLGYSRAEAAAALSGCAPDAGVEEMIKAGLRQLARRIQ
jgi:Holliday junction DNA helicase RuvA